MGLTTNRYRAVMGRATGSWLDLILICWLFLLAFPSIGFTDGLKLVDDVEFQPLASATQRLIEALDYLGSPLSEDALSAIREALVSDDHIRVVADIQKTLDPYCLAGVHINPESRVKVTEGAAHKELMQHGWRTFLVKVHNKAGVTAPFNVESENSVPLYERPAEVPSLK